MLEEGLDRIVARVVGQSDSVTVVAIDGHSAGGKSTFAARLAERVPAAIVAGDDFYRVMDEGERAALSPSQGAARYYDWERIRDEALVPLRGRQVAVFHPYDWDANDLADAVVTIAPKALVIVEGLFVSRPELAQFVDVAVLVTANERTRARRQANRADASSEWLARWDAAERWYFERVRQPSSFDVVTSGSARR